jgi:adenine-specific DNA-methyltransferase
MDETTGRYDQIEESDASRRPMTSAERNGESQIPVGARRYQLDNLTSSEYRPDTTVEFQFEGKLYFPGNNAHWKTTVSSLERLAQTRRLQATGGKSLRFVKFLDDFPATPISNIWSDIAGSI